MPQMIIEQAIALAKQHQQAGRFGEAEGLYRQVLAVQPNHPDALHFLGLLAHQVGHHEMALDLMRRSIAANPAAAHYYSNLGGVLRTLGRLEEFAEACRQAIALRPDFPDALTNLGIALQEMGKSAEAVEQYRKSLALRPNCAATLNNLGVALQALENVAEAEAAYSRAVAIQPDYADAWNNRASLRLFQGLLDEAVDCCRRAINLRPQQSSLHSSLLFTLEFHPHSTTQTIQAEQQRWAERHARPLFAEIRPHSNDRSPDRKLRIGYVSPNLRGHIIGLLLETFLVHHDRERFYIACYSDTTQRDAVTENLQRHSDLWRNTAHLGDAELAEQVRQDQIDILVDLNLHMGHDRMLVFARKPAPVQVTYIGYPASTGLETVDYRLTDQYLDPDEGSGFRVQGSGEANPLNPEPRTLNPQGPEKLIYLPHGYWPYKAAANAPDVNPLPAEHHGHVTFGCFNSFAKVNAEVIALWSQLMQGLPGSRLHTLIVGGPQNEHVYRAFEQHGIARQRIELLTRQPPAAFLKLHHAVDIILDPFPYCGHTTSHDALFMGVPVITLAGSRSVSRAGVSILSNLGLTDLIAHTPEQYVRIAAELAEDLPRLTELRRTLRQRMLDSPLMDGRQFARDIESAYRHMWQAWCAR
jgi:protein O-GlcNAc transferase